METLELTVDEGRPANAGRFFQLGHDLLVLLDELSDTPIEWLVEDLRLGSAAVRVAPPPSHPEDGQVLRLAVLSLAAVSEGNALPDGWSPDAVRVAHRFVEHGRPRENEQGWVPPHLTLLADDGPPAPVVSLTPELSERLADLQPFERRMPGSVRGMLVGFNVSRGNRASLRLPSKRIVRLGFETSLRVDLKEALLQSVEVQGIVRQDADGRVFHVRAESVRLLTKPDVRWVDIFGIDPAFTGEMTTDQYLEANRGEA